jgi:flagellar basal-body rod modification protein FlgD
MVSSVTNNGSTPPIATTTKKPNSLDQTDFLKLLTTQMTTQDPTDPVDNKEMVAQMAQFSSLSGITEMNDTLKAISAKLDLVLGTGSTDTSGDDAA